MKERESMMQKGLLCSVLTLCACTSSVHEEVHESRQKSAVDILREFAPLHFYVSGEMEGRRALIDTLRDAITPGQPNALGAAFLHVREEVSAAVSEVIVADLWQLPLSKRLAAKVAELIDRKSQGEKLSITAEPAGTGPRPPRLLPPATPLPFGSRCEGRMLTEDAFEAACKEIANNELRSAETCFASAGFETYRNARTQNDRFEVMREQLSRQRGIVQSYRYNLDTGLGGGGRPPDEIIGRLFETLSLIWLALPDDAAPEERPCYPEVAALLLQLHRIACEFRLKVVNVRPTSSSIAAIDEVLQNYSLHQCGGFP